MTARKPLATMVEVSEYLQTPIWTLRGWRQDGKGPRSMRVGRNIRYRWEDVDRWLDAQASTVAK